MSGPGAAERVGAGRRLFKVTFYGMQEGGLLHSADVFGRIRISGAGWLESMNKLVKVSCSLDCGIGLQKAHS